jgi:uncharacterized membrane protein YesL
MKEKRRFVALIILFTGFFATLAGIITAVYGIMAANRGTWIFSMGYYLALTSAVLIVITMVYCFITVIRHECKKRLWLAPGYALSIMTGLIGAGYIAFSFTVERHALGYTVRGALFLGVGYLLAFIITTVMMVKCSR